MLENRYSALSDADLEKIHESALSGSSSHNLKEIQAEWARRSETPKGDVSLLVNKQPENKRNFLFPNSIDDSGFNADVQDMMAQGPTDQSVRKVANKHTRVIVNKTTGK